ncbi:MAG: hypothetical protein K2H36_04725 [Clostridia bacterium]|nr:hypothetical protein [Clostridia bacterium]MDE6758606.1 hypothetical protein [Clostridia bacterium]
MAKDDNNIHTDHRKRMRQRIEKNGLDSLQDHEVLEYLLYSFIPRKDTNPIAHKLMETAGSFENVFNSSVEMLMNIPNMTYGASLFISIMPQLFKRYNLQRLGEKPIINTSDDAINFFKHILADEMEEHFYLAIVAPDGRVVDNCKISSGNSNQCKLDIKKFVLKTASSQAKDFFIAHNHPSGNPTPSLTDFEFTKWLVSLSESLELNLVDHIIVTKDKCFSFRKSDVLMTYAKDYRNFCKSTPIPDKYK